MNLSHLKEFYLLEPTRKSTYVYDKDTNMFISTLTQTKKGWYQVDFNESTNDIKLAIQYIEEARDKKLFKYLYTAIQTLSNIDTINRGGCLVSAYSIYLYLKDNKVLPKDFSIVALSHYEEELDLYIDFIQNNVSPNIVSHYVVYFEGKYYDSTGEYDISTYEYKYFISNKIEETCLYLLNECGTWNRSFDRSNNTYIEKSLGINLEKVNNEQIDFNSFASRDKSTNKEILNSYNLVI